MSIDLSEELLSALVLTLCVLCSARLRHSGTTKRFLRHCYLWNENNRTQRKFGYLLYSKHPFWATWLQDWLAGQENEKLSSPSPWFCCSEHWTGRAQSSAWEKRSKIIHINFLVASAMPPEELIQLPYSFGYGHLSRYSIHSLLSETLLKEEKTEAPTEMGIDNE